MDDTKRATILQRIAELPSGGITYKTINGKRYAYYQWRENGKQRARRVHDDELGQLASQIEERKELQAQIKQEEHRRDNVRSVDDLHFSTSLRIGEQLVRFTEPVAKWRKRACFDMLSEYIYGGTNDRVLVLYGLRRTGKTTLIRQLIWEMDAEHRARTAFMQVAPGNTLADVNRDLQLLEHEGFRYLFIDEVTFMDDFIEGAALFSDVFAASGMKIVLSGTDSLGFLFSEDEQLYDRCTLVHTTFIPYREFAGVLGIHDIDEFIRYGGTMSIGGADYNGWGPFSDSASASAYVDSAIASNIQHSLKNYRYGGHFRHLRELYDHGELTSAINRIVEDINHAFTIEVLTRNFKSRDLGISAKNLRSDRDNPTNILDLIDITGVTKRLKTALEIRDAGERIVAIDDAIRIEIREYLDLLDLTVPIDVASLAAPGSVGSITTIAQPGLRYAQADALVESLLGDETILHLPLADRMRILERIRSEIKGRMMEEIVLLETKKARPACNVFKLQLDIGEVDMVVFDKRKAVCELYEVKHSAMRDPRQCRHLLDEGNRERIAFRYGKIVGTYVIYRGEATEEGIVRYLNVQDYLMSLQ